MSASCGVYSPECASEEEEKEEEARIEISLAYTRWQSISGHLHRARASIAEAGCRACTPFPFVSANFSPSDRYVSSARVGPPKIPPFAMCAIYARLDLYYILHREKSDDLFLDNARIFLKQKLNVKLLKA